MSRKVWYVLSYSEAANAIARAPPSPLISPTTLCNLRRHTHTCLQIIHLPCDTHLHTLDSCQSRSSSYSSSRMNRQQADKPPSLVPHAAPLASSCLMMPIDSKKCGEIRPAVRFYLPPPMDKQYKLGHNRERTFQHSTVPLTDWHGIRLASCINKVPLGMLLAQLFKLHSGTSQTRLD